MKAKRPSEEAVQKATGLCWGEWFNLLDKQGMSDRDHRTIVAAVKASGKASPWWQQQVAVQYERTRGLRDVHQRSDGHYEISRLRTFPISAGELIQFVQDGRKRRLWIDVSLPGTAQKVLSGNPYFEFPWPDGRTLLQIVVEAKGPQKASITVVHRDLAGPEECEEKKLYWTERLTILKEILADRS